MDKWKHPEQKDGEVLFCNATRADRTDWIKDAPVTTRAGKVPYALDGNLIDLPPVWDVKPIFVKKKDLTAMEKFTEENVGTIDIYRALMGGGL